jgi:hypothetical protein
VKLLLKTINRLMPKRYNANYAAHNTITGFVFMMNSTLESIVTSNAATPCQVWFFCILFDGADHLGARALK